jgi:tetratricopeptide (TPR) repeat protein
MEEKLHSLLVKAEGLMEDRKDQEALDLLDGYAKKNPSENHPHLAFMRGLLNYRLERMETAEAFFIDAADRYPCFGEAWQNLAVVRYAQKRPAEAAEAMEKASLLIRPEKPELIYQTALFRIKAGQLEKALPLLQGLSRRKEPSPEWLQTYADVLTRKGRFEDAAALREKMGTRQDSPEQDYVTAALHLKAGAPQKALPILEKWTAKTPLSNGDAKWLFLLAMTYDQMDQPEKAVTAMARADLNDPGISAEMRLQAAFFWMRRDKPGRALPLLTETANSPRASRISRMALVKALVLTGSAPKAEPTLRGLLNEAPGEVEIWRLACWVAMEQKDYPRAAAALEVTYRLEPPEAKEWRRLGDLYRLAGVPLKAAEAYQRVFGPDPGAQDLDLLTDTYLQGHALREAIEAADHAVRKDPSARRWARLGDIRLKAREYGKAMDAFQQAARMDDTGGRMSLKAGYAAWKAEQMAPAKEAFQTALRRAGSEDKTAVRAAQALAAIRQIMERPR